MRPNGFVHLLHGSQRPHRIATHQRAPAVTAHAAARITATSPRCRH
ncbi:hypothetical protein [Streptomyces cucumeris]